MLCRSGGRWRAVASRGLAGGPAARFLTKVMDNPLPLGAGALVVGLLQWRRIRARPRPEPEVGPAEPLEGWRVECYRALPLRHLSRLWGAVNEAQLPGPLRTLVLSTYVRAFGCCLEEADPPDLASYPSLGSFFRRRLRAGARPVAGAGLVSPADGAVLRSGPLGPGRRVEQVKGVQYSLAAFLGGGALGAVTPAVGPALSLAAGPASPPPCTDLGTTSDATALEGPIPAPAPPWAADPLSPALEPRPGHRLHQLVIYLAPGDYHGFHSPADWTVLGRRHFPGELLSVSPALARRLPDLFSRNERVSYLGRWQHGFFSLTAVGATNVGSVVVGLDPELATNTKHWERDTFHQKVWPEGVPVGKGDYFGEFNLGSTVVLIFEAPEDFSFCSLAGEGCRVRVGQGLL